MVEILSPVGDFETLRAAIQAKADAVYFGIEGLNMRSGSAKNFKISDLKEISEITKKEGVKTYLTLNTLVYQHELPRLKKILEEVKKQKLNAIIASDFAVINLAKSFGIDVHISTQASIANSESAKFYSQFASCLVLARECSLKQIKEIKSDLLSEGLDTKIEVFVHGALCVAESGRCFMSQFHNRISANRGQCLQECRRLYKIVDLEEPRREFVLDYQYVMSPKDLCALPVLDKLLDSGVDVLKIEGRAKGPEYVYAVTKVYCEAVEAINDNSFTKSKVLGWLEQLEEVYNRGFTTNFLLSVPTNDSWANTYGSVAKKIKKRVGLISNYYKKVKIAEAIIENHDISVGDKILITGPTTGVLYSEITSLMVDESSVETAKKAIVTFPLSDLVRKNDKLFIVLNNEVDPDEEKMKKYGIHEPFKTTKKSKGCN